MDTEVDEVIECPACGARQTMTIIKSANVARMPHIKRQLLDGTFMQHTCRSCSATLEIERDLLWMDLERKLMILCFEPAAAADIEACEAEAIEVYRHAAWENCPPVVRQQASEMSLRVVFGYDELREKVLCAEHDLDDKMIEYLKLALLVANPDWHQSPFFLGVRLIEVRPASLVFMHDVDGDKPLVEVHMDMLHKIVAQPRSFVDWAPQIWRGPYVNANSVSLVDEHPSSDVP